MIEYAIKYSNTAVKNLDDIFNYIYYVLKEPEIAEKYLSELENEILSLQNMPNRCALRQIGLYAFKGYRQLSVKNFTVIFRVDEINKQVIIITVRYSMSSF